MKNPPPRERVAAVSTSKPVFKKEGAELETGRAAAERIGGKRAQERELFQRHKQEEAQNQHQAEGNRHLRVLQILQLRRQRKIAAAALVEGQLPVKGGCQIAQPD